jgi:hypothetical protein
MMAENNGRTTVGRAMRATIVIFAVGSLAIGAFAPKRSADRGANPVGGSGGDDASIERPAKSLCDLAKEPGQIDHSQLRFRADRLSGYLLAPHGGFRLIVFSECEDGQIVTATILFPEDGKPPPRFMQQFPVAAGTPPARVEVFVAGEVTRRMDETGKKPASSRAAKDSLFYFDVLFDVADARVEITTDGKPAVPYAPFQ